MTLAICLTGGFRFTGTGVVVAICDSDHVVVGGSFSSLTWSSNRSLDRTLEPSVGVDIIMHQPEAVVKQKYIKWVHKLTQQQSFQTGFARDFELISGVGLCSLEL